MKIYILVFDKDIQSTPGSIEELVKISRNKEELEVIRDKTNSEIDDYWGEDGDMEWDGVSYSSKPYMYIKEKEI